MREHVIDYDGEKIVLFTVVLLLETIGNCFLPSTSLKKERIYLHSSS